MTVTGMIEPGEYKIERVFDAPAALVWRTWTEPDLVAKWYGPGVETVIHEMDVKPGGVWKVEMRWGENAMFQRADYTDVDSGAKLVWLHASTDADWQITTNPMMPDWPRILLTTVTFVETAGKTHLCLTWVPHNATEAEIAFFKQAIDGANKGWAAGMDMLAELLKDLQVS